MNTRFRSPFLRALLITSILLAWISGANATNEFPAIVVRDGAFVQKETGKKFVPLGCNFIHLGNAASGISGHATFCPGVYNAADVERMMADLSAHGLNTVRTFQAYAVGRNGILESKDATHFSPGYLANLIDFLRAAQRHSIHVIFTTDTWLPDSPWLAEALDSSEAPHQFSPKWDPAVGTNNFLTAQSPVRTRANQMVELIRAIQKADPALLRVVLAWEIENECSFDATKEPLAGHSPNFPFAGKSYDLSTDEGAQTYMDDVAIQWCNFNVRAIHQVDPEALVSLSVFPFACVGRRGPGHLLEDKTNDHRIPVRPAALLRSELSYIDLHIYAYKKGDETFEQDFQAQVTSDECPSLVTQAQAAGKPILIGETGVPSKFMAGTCDRNGVHYHFDYKAGIPLLGDQLLRLKRAGFSGALFWHYGWQPALPAEDYPTLVTFPEFEATMCSW